MTTPDKNIEQDADALAALAGGMQESAAETEDLVNPLGEPAHDRFTPLVLPSELGLPIDDPPPAEAVEAEAATAEGDAAGAVAADSAASVGTATADPPTADIAASGSFPSEAAAVSMPAYAASPARRYASPRPTGFAALFTTAGLSKAAARHRLRLFRRILIPALAGVGLTLVIICVVTLIMLLVGNSANSIGSGRLYIHQFGKYIVIAGMPLGAILLMGAWLFFMELEKLKPIADEETSQKGEMTEEEAAFERRIDQAIIGSCTVVGVGLFIALNFITRGVIPGGFVGGAAGGALGCGLGMLINFLRHR